jgi:hypothetical protein
MEKKISRWQEMLVAQVQQTNSVHKTLFYIWIFKSCTRIDKLSKNNTNKLKEVRHTPHFGCEQQQ